MMPWTIARTLRNHLLVTGDDAEIFLAATIVGNRTQHIEQREQTVHLVVNVGRLGGVLRDLKRCGVTVQLFDWDLRAWTLVHQGLLPAWSDS